MYKNWKKKYKKANIYIKQLFHYYQVAFRELSLYEQMTRKSMEAKTNFQPCGFQYEKYPCFTTKNDAKKYKMAEEENTFSQS